MTALWNCPNATSRSSASGATGCRGARSSDWRSPGCSSRTRPSSSSTRPPVTSTPRTRSRCRTRAAPAFADQPVGSGPFMVRSRTRDLLRLAPVTRTARNLGRAARVDRSRTHYQDVCAATMAPGGSLSGLKIREVPTTLSPDGRSRPPHLRTWRDGWRHLRFLLLYSPRWLFLYPGVVLALAGLAVTAWLLPGPQNVGGVTFDVDTLVYAVGALLVGFHFCVFAVSAKIFGIQTGLLPRDPAFEKWFRYFDLEAGVSSGAALIVIGLSAALYAVVMWHRSGFGHLLPTQALRITRPAPRWHLRSAPAPSAGSNGDRGCNEDRSGSGIRCPCTRSHPMSPPRSGARPATRYHA